MNEYHEKINAIVKVLGMSTEVQAKAMNIKPQSVKNKRYNTNDSFNKYNYLSLLNYVKSYLESL